MGFLSGLVKSVAAPLVGGVLGLASGESDQDHATAAAAEANKFTEKQLKNRHQWEVQDLRAAGLNPILSAHGSPSIGSSAKAETIPTSQRAIEGANSALMAARTRAEIKAIEAGIQKTKAETVTQGTQAVYNSTAAREAAARTAVAAADAAGKTQWNRIKGALVPSADFATEVGSTALGVARAARGAIRRKLGLTK